MARAHKVNVVATPPLKIQHHPGNFFRLHQSSDPFPTDFPVLAKDTAEITPTEKYRSRAIPAPQDIFLAMMRTETVNHSALAGPTDGALDRDQAIDATITGAKIAVLHLAKGLTHSRLELSGSKQLQIGGLETRTRIRSLHGGR
jgi:hypothetical protein